MLSEVNWFCHRYPDAQVVIRLAWERYVPIMGYVACMDTVYETRHKGRMFPATSNRYRNFVARHFDCTWPKNLRFSVTRQFQEQLAPDEMAALYKEDEVDIMVGFARLLNGNGI
jgi:hypothetical protein